MHACISNKDANFDTLKNPLHGTAGRYNKPTPTRHGITLGSLANGSANTAGGGSCESVRVGNNLDKLLHNVKDRYDAEDDIEL